MISAAVADAVEAAILVLLAVLAAVEIVGLVLSLVGLDAARLKGNLGDDGLEASLRADDVSLGTSDGSVSHCAEFLLQGGLASAEGLNGGPAMLSRTESSTKAVARRKEHASMQRKLAIVVALAVLVVVSLVSLVVVAVVAVFLAPRSNVAVTTMLLFLVVVSDTVEGEVVVTNLPQTLEVAAFMNAMGGLAHQLGNTVGNVSVSPRLHNTKLANGVIAITGSLTVFSP